METGLNNQLMDLIKSTNEVIDLIKSGTHEEKVYVTPKSGNIKPYWKTVRKANDEDEPAQPRGKKPDEEKKPRKRKQDEEKNPRGKKQDTKSKRVKKQDDTKNSAQSKQPKNNPSQGNESSQSEGITTSNDKSSNDIKTDGIELSDEDKKSLQAQVEESKQTLIKNVKDFIKSKGKKDRAIDVNVNVTNVEKTKLTARMTINIPGMTKAGYDYFAKTTLNQLGKSQITEINYDESSGTCEVIYNDTHEIASKQLDEREKQVKDHEEKIKQLENVKKGILPRNYDSDLCEKIGKKHYDALRDLADNSEHIAGRLWSQYADDIKVTGKVNSYNNSYNETTDSIQIADMDKVAKGNSYANTYTIFFHESGHLIDYKKGTKSKSKYGGTKIIPYSVTYKDGAFAKAIHADVDNLIKSHDNTGTFHVIMKEKQALKDEVYTKMEEMDLDVDWFIENNMLSEDQREDYEGFFNEIIETAEENDGIDDDMMEELNSVMDDLIDNALKSKGYNTRVIYSTIDDIRIDIRKSGSAQDWRSVSDMIEGATQGFIQLGHGHGEGYWVPQDGKEINLSTEAFAEIFESEISSPKALECIKKYLPSTYNVYKDMAKSLSKGINNNGNEE